MRARVVLTAVALVLGACGGDDGGGPGSGPSFDSPDDLAAAIIDAGLGCDDYTRDGTNGQIVGSEASGTCTISDETTEIALFSDAEHLQARLDLGGVGCDAGDGFGITGFPFVVGPNWVIAPQTEPTAGAISEAIGGDQRTIEC